MRADRAICNAWLAWRLALASFPSNGGVREATSVRCGAGGNQDKANTQTSPALQSNIAFIIGSRLI